MSKSQFELIARVLRDTQIDSDDEYDERKRRQLAEAFAAALSHTQAPGQFDRERFIRLVLDGPE